MSEAKTDAILNALPWRCFCCDFVTNDREEAAAHFGDRDDAEEFKPICRWWNFLEQDERLQTLQDTLKQLAAEQRDNQRLRTHIEGLEYQVESIPQQIKSYKPFRNCSTIYGIFCEFDSMEGRALAAEEALREMREANTAK
jgi:hypothetical protein